MEKKKTTYKFCFSKMRWVVFTICIAALLVSLIFESQIDATIRHTAVHSSEKENYEMAISNDFSVHFVDVGQADCIILCLPDGKKGMIDAGDNTQKSKSSVLNYAKEKIFKNESEMVFDFVIMTHSDADHVGGFGAVFENFIVNKVYRPAIFYNKTENASANEQTLSTKEMQRAELLGLYESSAYPETQAKTVSTHVYFNALSGAYNETDELGNETDVVFSFAGLNITSVEYDYSIQFYSPNHWSYENINDFSPIIVASYKGKSICLTGDAGIDAESEVVAIEGFPNVDALKLGHHGSATSTSQQFLDVLSPKYVFISVGSGNSYGHPSGEVMGKVHQQGINKTIYRTDINGDLVFSVTKDGDIMVGITVLDGFFSWLCWWHICIILALILFFGCFLKKIVGKEF